MCLRVTFRVVAHALRLKEFKSRPNSSKTYICCHGRCGDKTGFTRHCGPACTWTIKRIQVIRYPTSLLPSIIRNDTRYSSRRCSKSKGTPAKRFDFLPGFSRDAGRWKGCLGWHKHAPHPKTMQNHSIGQVKTTMSGCGRWCAPKSAEHAHATTWNVAPKHTLNSKP